MTCHDMGHDVTSWCTNRHKEDQPILQASNKTIYFDRSIFLHRTKLYYVLSGPITDDPECGECWKFYCKDTEPLYHSFMYSLVSLLSGIFPFLAMHSLLVTKCWMYALWSRRSRFLQTHTYPPQHRFQSSSLNSTYHNNIIAFH